MIVTRTPLRISFVGGGSDRPSFYQEEPGACVAAAIDKYVYVVLNDKYDGAIRAAYSLTENVQTVDELQHELIRESLRFDADQRDALCLSARHGIEIHSIADVPGGSGLGSSSSFTVGLLHALNPQSAPPSWLAETASQIEIARCQKPIGKQDQYTAAYGGVNLLSFTAQGVTVTPIACDLDALSSHCLLLDTGITRSGDAGQHLAAQQQDRDDVRQLAVLAHVFAKDLECGDLERCGAVLREAWQIKRRFVAPVYSRMVAVAEQAGAWGGKLCGAGGGGFLLLFAPPERHQAVVQALRLRHVPIRVGGAGSEVVWPAR